MKALALVVSLSMLAPMTAQAAEDAPLAVGDVPAVGGTLSADALCLSPDETLRLAQRLESDKAQLAALKAAPQGIPVAAVVIGAVVAAVAVGAAAVAGFEAGKSAATPK